MNQKFPLRGFHLFETSREKRKSQKNKVAGLKS